MLIDEGLPDDPLEAEVVLHVRRHLRESIRAGSESAPEDLAMLFGLPRIAGSAADWQHAAARRSPIAAGAELRSRELGASVVTLGRDAAHLLECARWLAERKEGESAYHDIVAPDLATLLTLSRARNAAVARAHGPDGTQRFLPIVIVGPTGTGKELLARAVHEIWARERGASAKAFHPLHLAGMPSHLIYAELFGHEAGAFTGADKKRAGRIVSADGGTLFIDEVGDLPAEAQVAMLRFLQDGSLSALGRDDARKVDVRIIAATWHDLEHDVAERRFRADLFHRLHAGSALRLDALKHRRVPLRALVNELVRRKQHHARPPVGQAAHEALDRCDWPGNLRELDGVLDEAISAARGGTVRLEHLPSQIVHRYLGLPLHERALGTLADEVDDGEVSAEIVGWRVERLAESIRRTRAPANGTESRRVHGFLAQILDPSAEHQASVREAAEAAKMEDDAEHARMLAEVLTRVVATPGVPDVVVHVASTALTAAQTQHGELRRRVVEALKKIDDDQPWLRVYRDIAGLPILQGQANGEVAQLMQLALRAVVSFWPQGLALLRATAKERGAAGVFQEVMKSLPAEANDADAEDLLPQREKPKDVTKEEWELVASRCSSYADAARRTKFSERQIKKLMAEHGVVVPWVASKRGAS